MRDSLGKGTWSSCPCAKCCNVRGMALRHSHFCKYACSEEVPELQDMEGPVEGGFSVAFDPLDGSSIVDTNFIVGTIFGVWLGDKLTGVTGRDQVAAAMGIYGPRTTYVLVVKGFPGTHDRVLLHVSSMEQRVENVEKTMETPAYEQKEILNQLIEMSNRFNACVDLLASYPVYEAAENSRNTRRKWQHVKETTQIGEGKMFSPGNLRATFDNADYDKLINYYVREKYTLRYTGGMVPDVNQIIVKEKGVFTNVISPTTKAKLRLLFEVSPLGFLIEQAGGYSSDGTKEIQ
ncbi:hypothetical protein IFM89_038553 [Coptis chinensis]|uniref:Fructose-bisphosphatase n=1 Tax=Coptis chinensis TaxID=261450 RepID=A0A835HHD4_9MAGN|nr:hypothetical protein IFM89_038553 [Coptis chinensis]